MAVTITLYNHATKLLANKEVDLTALKVMLLNTSGAFDATDTDITDVSTNEVDGSGWTTGGETLANVAVTTVSTNDAKLDADDVEVTATGGAIGPAEYAVIYDSASGDLIAFIDFDGAKEAGETTPFKIVWSANGIVTFTYT